MQNYLLLPLNKSKRQLPNQRAKIKQINFLPTELPIYWQDGQILSFPKIPKPPVLGADDQGTSWIPRSHTPMYGHFPPMSGLWEKNHLVENIGILR